MTFAALQEEMMAKFAIVALAALLLSGCAYSSRLESNVATGALLGGGAGMAVGGLARGTLGGAVAGGVIGAVAGGLIGAAVTPPRRCYIRTSTGRLRRAWCRG
jgi:osmotically inducible lipoprotein OsmB